MFLMLVRPAHAPSIDDDAVILSTKLLGRRLVTCNSHTIHSACFFWASLLASSAMRRIAMELLTLVMGTDVAVQLQSTIPRRRPPGGSSGAGLAA
jgi:hypothetical protein